MTQALERKGPMVKKNNPKKWLKAIQTIKVNHLKAYYKSNNLLSSRQQISVIKKYLKLAVIL